ncbi:hypothetical protein [Celeribacter sp.]|uniref:hypothetical protein n=1 Tax=Celeribacter sp. TaxID=1890673 RepID=UPI003A8F51A8
MSPSNPPLSARLALSVAAAMIGVAGLVMLARAAWLALALRFDPITATAIEGGVLVVVAGFMWLLARPSAPPTPPVESAAEANPWATLAGAFVEGMRAGRGYGASR